MHLKYFLSALPFVSCLFVAALGVFVFAQNKRAGINRLFASICLTLCAYNFGVFLMYVLDDDAGAAAAAAVCVCSTALLTALLPHFIMEFISENGGPVPYAALKLSFFYALAAAVFKLALDGAVVGVPVVTATGYVSSGGPFFNFYAACIIFSVIYSIALLYFSQLTHQTPDYKLKVRHIFLGTLICSLFGIFDILKKMAGMLGEISTLEYGVIIFCFLTAYAIVKHKFLHIEFAVKKGALYSILMILVALTVLSVAVAAEQLTQNWLDSSSFAVNLLNAFIVGIFFDPVRDRLQRILNKHFFPRLVSVEIDEAVMKNNALLDCIAGEKIDELKLLKSNLEKIIDDYEKNGGSKP
jgi:hypothetical protein